MSEPVFEASVRLRADVGDFEREAQTALKRSTDRLEQQAQEAQQRIQRQLAQQTPQTDLIGGALERARGLASRPLPIEVVANTEPFDREVNIAFKRAEELAEQHAAQLKQVADEAGEAAQAASKAIGEAGGFEARAQAQSAYEAAALARREAERAASEARSQLQDIRGEAQEALLAPLAEFQTKAATEFTRAETSRLLGDAAAEAEHILQGEILSRQAALEALKFQQAEYAAQLATATTAERESLLALAERAAAERRILQQEIAQIQATGQVPPPPGAPGEQRGGFFDALTGPGGILRSRSGSSSLAGILGTTARFGLAGLAFGTVISTISELQRSLRATGDEAFTTEGRIRNLGAELLSGNLIGGIKALTAARPAQLVGGLAEDLEKFKQGQDELAISRERLIALQRQGAATEGDRIVDGKFIADLEGASDALEEYLNNLVDAGAISLGTALDLGRLAVELEEHQRLGELAAQALDDYARSVARAGSEAAKFGPEGGAAGLRGALVASQGVAAGTGTPGAVVGQQQTGIPRPIITQPFPNPVFQAPDPQVAADIRASLAERIQNDQARLQAELRNARLLRDQKRQAFENAKAAAEAADQAGAAAGEYRDLVVATTAVRNALVAVRENARANAEAIAAADARVRAAEAGRIADPDARLQAQLGVAREEEQQARAALERAKRAGKSARDIAEAEAEYAEAVTDRVNIEQAIAENARQAAEAARQDARNAEELRLANNIAAALRTEQKADDRRFFNEAIDYYRQQARDASLTKTERERARGNVQELRAQLAESLRGDDDPGQLEQLQLQNALARAQQVGSITLLRRAAQRLVDFWEEQVRSASGVEREQARASLIAARGRLRDVAQAALDLQEQRIQNRVQAARLTEGKEDDKRAADDLIKFWERQVAQAVGVDKERKRSQLISARLARQALDETEKQTTTVFDLLTRTAARFAEFAGNLRNENNPFTRESFVAEQAQFFRPGVTPADILAGPTGFTANLQRFRERNDQAGRIPGAGLEQATERNTSALERLTDTLQRRGLGDFTDRSPLRPEDTAALRWTATGEFWRARQARNATEAGIGATGAGF